MSARLVGEKRVDWSVGQAFPAIQKTELDQYAKAGQLAAQFGGGGHKAAAGAFLNEPFERARHDVLNFLRHQMQAVGLGDE